MGKLPHPFNWYYKSFIVENKCPFCGSEHVYNSRDNDVVFCRHYQSYVSLYDCGASMGEDAGAGGCKACQLEPNFFCPIEKTSIHTIDCRKESNPEPFCQKCKPVKIMIPYQAELTSELVCVCDDCDKGVDFAKRKTFEKFSG